MGYEGHFPDRVLKLMPAAERKKLGKAGVTTEEALAKAEAIAERDIQHNLTVLLEKHRGVTPLVMPFGRKSGCRAGWPDMTFCYRGVPCCWEVKTAKGVSSPEQIKLRVKLEQDGWRYAVVRSVEQARGILNQLNEEANRRLLP